jgi:hypothetical protein
MERRCHRQREKERDLPHVDLSVKMMDVFVRYGRNPHQ